MLRKLIVQAMGVVVICGFAVVEGAAQTCPDLDGFYEIQGARGGDVEGDYAYIVDRSASPYFEIVDISVPTTPVPVGSCDAWGDAVEVVGGYAYVAGGSMGLRIVDISDPQAPHQVGIVDTFEAQDVAVSGGFAYVADHWSGLRVINVDDPAAPYEVGFYEPPTSIASNIAVREPYIFMSRSFDTGSGFTSHLLVIDVTDPAAPALAGSVDIPSTIYDIEVAGDLVLVAADQSGLRIVDVLNPGSPVEIGSIAPWGNIWGVTVAGQLAFLANYQYAVHVVDFSSPQAPVEIFPYVPTAERAIGAVVNGSRLLVVGRPDVFDISCAFPVFRDGFESGDTSAWSATVP